MTQTAPMPMCPMARMCKRMAEKPGSGLWLLVPAIFNIVLGVLIVLYPQILAWLVAIAMILMGFAMLMMIRFMGGIKRHMHNSPG